MRLRHVGHFALQRHPRLSSRFNREAFMRLLLTLVLISTLPAAALAHDGRHHGTLVIGVLAIQPAAQTEARWQPLADYLERKLDGVSVRISALDYDALGEALKRQGVDMALTNASHYIALRRNNPLSGALVTLVGDANGVVVNGFGGVIVARAERDDIRQLDDLAGVRIASTSAQSLGAYQAQVATLIENGFGVPRHIAFLGPSHLGVIEAVVAGQYDAGFVRSGVIESMMANGQLDRDVLRVINPQALGDFPYAVSTRLYPEWPLFASPHVSAELVRQVTAALLLLDPDSETSQAIGIHGFSIPADYEVVADTLRLLRLPPFDAPSTVRLYDIWAQHAETLIAIAMLITVALVFSLRLLVLGRRAQLANQRFNQLFGMVPNPIAVLEDGVFTDCNHATLRVLGLQSKHELIGKSPADISPPRQMDGEDSAVKAERITERVLGGGSHTFDWSFLGANGAIPMMEVSVQQMGTGNRQRMLSVWHDITERQHAHQLVASELALFANGPVIVIEWGAGEGWPILSVSSSVTHNLGYTPEEMTAKGFDFSKLLHPDDLERINLDSRASILSNKTCWEQSYRLRRKNGEYAWYFDFTLAIRDEDAKITRMRGYLTDQTLTKQLELELAQERKSLFNILWGTDVGTWEWNVQTGETRLNERWADIIGYTLEQLSPISINTWTRHVHPDDLQRSEQALQQHFSGQTDHYECEVRMRHRKGHWVWVLDRGKVVEWREDGQPLWVSGTHTEVTARRRMEEQHRSLIEALSDAGTMLMVTDAEGVVRYTNRIMQEEFGDSTGADKLDDKGLNLTASIMQCDEEPDQHGTIRCQASDTLGRIFDVTSVPYTDTDGAACKLHVLRDMTLEHQRKMALEHIAYHDPLTGAANRPLFSDRLLQAMADARRRNQFVALVYIDLDGFKEVNDNYGHLCGDALLTQLARRMKNSLRESDTVARLGGDEFAVLLRDLPMPETAMPLVNRLLEDIARPTKAQDHTVQVSASIGVSFYPGHDRFNAEPDQLLRQADQAMYKAKISGKNRIKVFGEPLDEASAWREPG